MPLHYVDPHKKRGPVYKAYVRFARTRLGLAYSLGMGGRVDPWLYKMTGGRYPAILGSIASAPLTATGAKSGMPRQHQVTYFHDGLDPVLLASYGGGPRNPQWFYNLRANPECSLGDEKYVAAEVLEPEEYARLYSLAERVYAGYGDYRIKAEAAGRRIPIFRLKPASD